VAIIGAIVSQMFLSSHVGIGSSGHCLAGDFLIIVATSSTVTGRKLDSGVSTYLLEMQGAGKVAVEMLEMDIVVCLRQTMSAICCLF